MLAIISEYQEKFTRSLECLLKVYISFHCQIYQFNKLTKFLAKLISDMVEVPFVR